MTAEPDDLAALRDRAGVAEAKNIEKDQFIELLTHGKSPCGHWSAYALTADGGKTITCTRCDLAKALADRDLAREEREKAEALPDIEDVSALVHLAWMEMKRSQGVTTRRSEAGEELMVPYAQLSEAAKELDRGTVRAVYAAIQSAKEVQRG